jgi:hypothetical protein
MTHDPQRPAGSKIEIIKKRTNNAKQANEARMHDIGRMMKDCYKVKQVSQPEDGEKWEHRSAWQWQTHFRNN